MGSHSESRPAQSRLGSFQINTQSKSFRPNHLPRPDYQTRQPMTTRPDQPIQTNANSCQDKAEPNQASPDQSGRTEWGFRLDQTSIHICCGNRLRDGLYKIQRTCQIVNQHVFLAVGWSRLAWLVSSGLVAFGCFCLFSLSWAGLG